MNFRKSFSFFLVSPFELCKLTHSLCVFSMTWHYSLQQTVKMDIAGEYDVLYFVSLLNILVSTYLMEHLLRPLGLLLLITNTFCTEKQNWKQMKFVHLTEMESKFLLEICFFYRVMSFLCAVFVFSTSLACKMIDLKQIAYACSSNHICTH